jgi:hypothetical protein
MLSGDKNIKKILGWGAKFLVATLFLIGSFFPLGNIFQIPLAQAKTCVLDSIYYAGGPTSLLFMDRTKEVGDSEPCPSRYHEENPAGEGASDVFAGLISDIVYIFTVGLGSSIAYIAAYFFNFAIYISLNSTAYAINFLNDGWVSVRDIANMGFIFILIYIAVTIMLKAETGDTMKMLAKVIVVALLINFSFFFVRVVIDVGNIVAVNFYNAIASTAPTIEESLSDDLGKKSTPNALGTLGRITTLGSKGVDLTAGIMGAIQVQNILNESTFKEFSNAQNSSYDGGFLSKTIALVMIYICVGIIFGMLAALFFTIGIKFIVRVVILWIVIISSPLALLLYAVPGSKQAAHYFDEWRKALFTYSFYPAIFLFLFIIIQKFAYELGSCTSQTTGAHVQSLVACSIAGVSGSEATGFYYVASLIGSIGIKLGFVMVMLYAAMQASSMVSNMGGQLAAKISARPDKIAAGLARFSRATPTFFPRYAANATYRGVGPGAWAKGADKYIKGSRWENANWWTKYYGTKFRENAIQPIAKKSIGGFMSRTDYDKAKEASEKELKIVALDKQNKADISDLVALQPALNDIKKKEDTNAKNKRTNRQNAKLMAKNPGLKLPTDLPVTNLTDEEYATKARGAELRGNIKKMGKREIETFKAEDIRKIVGELSEGQMKIVKDSDKYSEKDRREFETEWHKKSAASALKRSEKEIGALREIKSRLEDMGLNMEQLTKYTEPAEGSHIVITEDAIAEIQSEADKNLATARQISKAQVGSKRGDKVIGQVDKDIAEQQVIELQKAVAGIKSLKDSIKDMPRAIQEIPATDVNKARPAESGEFVVKPS